MLTLIALLHSVLGEQALLRPLFAREWEIDIPRWAAERILRFAWHLTSLAWIGLGVAMVGIPIAHALAWVCLVSALMVFVMLRGHLAWPMFLAAAGLAWASIDALPVGGVQTVVGGAAMLSGAVALLHVAWAFGLTWGLDRAVPTPPPGAKAFQPGALACLAVAVACACLAGLLVWPLVADAPGWSRVLLWVAFSMLFVRIVGNGGQVGFSRRDHSTPFAKADAAVFTPLVVALALGCAGALWLGGA
ncbi:MAG: DUF3995 domain-containing protein [Myxococcota bacterium]